MARVITARFAGTCRACGGPFAAGDRISYGAGMASHEACGPAQGRQARGSYGSRYAYTDSIGRRWYGRCEDAPCCGCCD